MYSKWQELTDGVNKAPPNSLLNQTVNVLSCAARRLAVETLGSKMLEFDSMLVLDSPHDFDISLAGGMYRVERASKPCKFYAPLTVRGIAKLYTISSDNSLIYVGISQQPLSSRLGYGFRANGKSGYYGYKWKSLESNLKLSVWTAKSNGVHSSLRLLEMVEAEVAYLCRERTGQWPTHQHEIHFYPTESWHRDAAKRIYEHAIADRT